MTFEFWDIVSDFRFLVMFGLVLAGFLPLLLSVKKTWDARGNPDGSNLE